MVSSQKVKNLVLEKSQEFNLDPSVMYRMYALEQFLKRISASDYSEYFVLKGGYLLTAKYGLSTRSTADLDSTIRNLDFNKSNALDLIQSVTQRTDEDTEYFELVGLKETREGFLYTGFEARLDYINGKMRTPISIDLTTGEELLPVEGLSKLDLMFEDGSLEIPCYPIDQVISDKYYTLMAYGAIDDTNSRSKDLYDMYFLTTFHQHEINYSNVYKSLQLTKEQRNLELAVNDELDILVMLSESELQKEYWEKYQESFVYAKDISFDDVMDAVDIIRMELHSHHEWIHDENYKELEPAESAFERVLQAFEITASPEQVRFANEIRDNLDPHLKLIVFNMHNHERWLLLDTKNVPIERQVEIVKSEVFNDPGEAEDHLVDEDIFKWVSHQFDLPSQKEFEDYTKQYENKPTMKFKM